MVTVRPHMRHKWYHLNISFIVPVLAIGMMNFLLFSATASASSCNQQLSGNPVSAATVKCIESEIKATATACTSIILGSSFTALDSAIASGKVAAGQVISASHFTALHNGIRNLLGLPDGATLPATTTALTPPTGISFAGTTIYSSAVTDPTAGKAISAAYINAIIKDAVNIQCGSAGTCTGNPATNAIACPNQLPTGSSIPYVSPPVATCDTTTPCQTTCASGYTFSTQNGGSCVGTCQGSLPQGAQLCPDQNPINSTTMYGTPPVVSCDTSTPCQTTCPSGDIWDTTSSACIAATPSCCPAGYIFTAGCPAGYYMPGSMPGGSCPTGYMCTSCPTGQEWNNTTASCCTPTTACSSTLNCGMDSCGISCGTCPPIGSPTLTTCSSNTSGIPGTCQNSLQCPVQSLTLNGTTASFPVTNPNSNASGICTVGGVPASQVCPFYGWYDSSSTIGAPTYSCLQSCQVPGSAATATCGANGTWPSSAAGNCCPSGQIWNGSGCVANPTCGSTNPNDSCCTVFKGGSSSNIGNYTPPAGTAFLYIWVWGAGGSGGSAGFDSLGGGGGGGFAYAEIPMSLIPSGDIITYNAGPTQTPSSDTQSDAGGGSNVTIYNPSNYTGTYALNLTANAGWKGGTVVSACGNADSAGTLIASSPASSSGSAIASIPITLESGGDNTNLSTTGGNGGGTYGGAGGASGSSGTVPGGGGGKGSTNGAAGEVVICADAAVTSTCANLTVGYTNLRLNPQFGEYQVDYVITNNSAGNYPGGNARLIVNLPIYPPNGPWVSTQMYSGVPDYTYVSPSLITRNGGTYINGGQKYSYYNITIPPINAGQNVTITSPTDALYWNSMRSTTNFASQFSATIACGNCAANTCYPQKYVSCAVGPSDTVWVNEGGTSMGWSSGVDDYLQQCSISSTDGVACSSWPTIPATGYCSASGNSCTDPYDTGDICVFKCASGATWNGSACVCGTNPCGTNNCGTDGCGSNCGNNAGGCPSGQICSTSGTPGTCGATCPTSSAQGYCQSPTNVLIYSSCESTDYINNTFVTVAGNNSCATNSASGPCQYYSATGPTTNPGQYCGCAESGYACLVCPDINRLCQWMGYSGVSSCQIGNIKMSDGQLIDNYYIWSCFPAACQGSTTGATPCATNLTPANNTTSWKAVSACPSASAPGTCDMTCNTGFTLSNGACVASCPTYPGCSTASVMIGGQCWSACNVGASDPSQQGTTSSIAPACAAGWRTANTLDWNNIATQYNYCTSNPGAPGQNCCTDLFNSPCQARGDGTVLGLNTTLPMPGNASYAYTQTIQLGCNGSICGDNSHGALSTRCIYGASVNNLFWETTSRVTYTQAFCTTPTINPPYTCALIPTVGQSCNSTSLPASPCTICQGKTSTTWQCE